jgi:nucleotide-binding universal stress UspA family protein
MYEVIVWATDGSDAADVALPVARDLARFAGARIVVVHDDEVAVGRVGGALSVHVDEDDLRAKVGRQVEELKGEGFDVALEFRRGPESPADAIVAVAKSAGASLIVVGTRGHGPIAGALLGSVTQQLLHAAPRRRRPGAHAR